MKFTDIPYGLFSEAFYLDSTSESGVRWRVEVRSGKKLMKVNCRAGDMAGSLDPRAGCYKVGYGGKSYLASRIVFCLDNGGIDRSLVVDHWNGVRTDNTPANLRQVTRKINCQNTKTSTRNTSTLKGVCRSGSKGRYNWYAQWQDAEGNHKSKAFSVQKYGEEGAKKLATEVREQEIASLNLSGQCYVNR